MFRDGPVQYPADNILWGRYLVPAQDVRPEMTAIILRANGEVVSRYTLCSLTIAER